VIVPIAEPRVMMRRKRILIIGLFPGLFSDGYGAYCSKFVFRRFPCKVKHLATNRLIIIAGERNDEKCKDYDFNHGATGNVLIRLLSKQSIGTAFPAIGDCYGQ